MIDRIADYINLLDVGYQDNVSPKVVKSINKSIKQVRIKGYNSWHPIRFD